MHAESKKAFNVLSPLPPTNLTPKKWLIFTVRNNSKQENHDNDTDARRQILDIGLVGFASKCVARLCKGLGLSISQAYTCC